MLENSVSPIDVVVGSGRNSQRDIQKQDDCCRRQTAQDTKVVAISPAMYLRGWVCRDRATLTELLERDILACSWPLSSWREAFIRQLGNRTGRASVALL